MNDRAIRLSWPDFVYELSALTKSIPKVPPLYLVGGALRDAWLRRAIDDLDVAVAGDAIAVARFVTDSLGADIYVMDRERDVARVFIERGGEKLSIDFARLRGPTLEDDLGDRDFTLNAMAADLLGDPSALIDPLNGVNDLRARVLRRCSPDSIANDPIRTLRAVRLCAQFDLKMHPDTAADVRRHAAELGQSSTERVRDEFFKLLGIARAARGLRVLTRLSLLERILPMGAGDLDLALAAVERMKAILTAISSRRTDNTAAAFDLGMLVIQLDRFRSPLQSHLAQDYGNGRSHAELLTLAALLHAFDGEAADAGATAAKALRLSRAEARILAAALSHCGVVGARDAWTTLDRHRYWFRLNESGIDALLLGAAISLGQAGGQLQQADWLSFVETATSLLEAWFKRYGEVVNPALYLDGHDVRALLDIGGGPRIGRILTALREAQVMGEVASVTEARAFVLRAGEQAQQ